MYSRKVNNKAWLHTRSTSDAVFTNTGVQYILTIYVTACNIFISSGCKTACFGPEWRDKDIQFLNPYPTNVENMGSS